MSEPTSLTWAFNFDRGQWRNRKPKQNCNMKGRHYYNIIWVPLRSTYLLFILKNCSFNRTKVICILLSTYFFGRVAIIFQLLIIIYQLKGFHSRVLGEVNIDSCKGMFTWPIGHRSANSKSVYSLVELTQLGSPDTHYRTLTKLSLLNETMADLTSTGETASKSSIFFSHLKNGKQDSLPWGLIR